MPLNVEISLVNTINGESFDYQQLDMQNALWQVSPPQKLEPFTFHRCQCMGPSSGFHVPVKYGGLICWFKVTAWGVSYQKSTPTHYDIEVVMVQNKAPYRIEMLLI